MKKLVTLVLIFVFITANMVSAATLPSYATEMNQSYDEECEITMSLDSADSIVALLKEIEIPEEIEYYTDIKALIESLANYNGKMDITFNCNKDFTKYELSMSTYEKYNVVLNKNFDLSANAVTKAWLNIDISDKNAPVYKMIFTSPVNNKYFVLDLYKIITDDQHIFTDTLSKFLNKEYVESVAKISKELIEKYGDIKVLGNKLTISFDNESFTAMLDDILAVIMNYLTEMLSTLAPSYTEYSQENSFSFKGLKLLGKNGIKSEYKISNNKISEAKTDVDLSIDISNIYETLSGNEWEFDSEGIMNFKISMCEKIKNIGSAKVEYPQLTDENSVDIAELINSDMSSEYEEYEEYVPYPYFYADANTDILWLEGDKIYIPLRKTFESAYEDTAQLTYDNGLVTITSEYFTDFEKIEFTVGEDKVYKDGAEFYTGEIVEKDGICYIDYKFFEDVLGWELNYCSYDILDKYYSYSFYTSEWPEY